MAQAIITKYFGPRNVRGSRVKATAKAGSVYIGYDDELSTEQNHLLAARVLANSYGWLDPVRGKQPFLTTGTLPNGDTVHLIVTP